VRYVMPSLLADLMDILFDTHDGALKLVVCNSLLQPAKASAAANRSNPLAKLIRVASLQFI